MFDHSRIIRRSNSKETLRFVGFLARLQPHGDSWLLSLENHCSHILQDPLPDRNGGAKQIWNFSPETRPDSDGDRTREKRTGSQEGYPVRQYDMLSLPIEEISDRSIC